MASGVPGCFLQCEAEETEAEILLAFIQVTAADSFTRMLCFQDPKRTQSHINTIMVVTVTMDTIIILLL